METKYVKFLTEGKTAEGNGISAELTVPVGSFFLIEDLKLGTFIVQPLSSTGGWAVTKEVFRELEVILEAIKTV